MYLYICIYIYTIDIFVVSKKTFSYIDFFYIVLDFALLLPKKAEAVARKCS